MPNALVEIKNLSIGYRTKSKHNVVFKNITTNFYEGMFIGIIGKNGLGKSTLIRTIAGLQDKLQGEIKISEQEITSLEKTELAKLVALVLTEKVGGFNLTVHDLVSLGRVPYTNSSHKLSEYDNALISECIKLFGLDEHLDKPVLELSDGMFQKAMIAKGLTQETKLLLLDEPTAYLDFPSKHQLFLMLKNIVDANNKCIVASSHDIDLLLKYATHLLIMAEDNLYEFIEVKKYRESDLFSKVTNGYFG